MPGSHVNERDNDKQGSALLFCMIIRASSFGLVVLCEVVKYRIKNVLVLFVDLNEENAHPGSIPGPDF